MIEVVTTECDPGESWKFDKVTKWHVDEAGYLHLLYPDSGGNAATFAPKLWTSVVDVTTDPTPTLTADAIGESVGAAINASVASATRRVR